MDTQEEIVRLLALQVRSRFESQADAIHELAKAGVRSTRIAELVGTTTGTVTVTLAKTKRAAAKRASSTNGAK